ncbi:MAG: hypothetical protein E7773_06090 [Sphingomonas sp.]|uniref:hypothetical protein n=1 Tax=Sphingomonas sp. TaxID=28214 RepID=UPI0012163DFE|nr:hypothetical protein [Sphingomonas sp.]THD36581.1 MAG: hypothetical protein E7773_06090 [Sphingomonas sp.]
MPAIFGAVSGWTWHLARARSMAMTPPDIATLVADPCWLAYRYDWRRDEVQFVRLPREAHRTAVFLPGPAVANAPRHAVPRASLPGYRPVQAPLHLILHSGLTGSTLLAQALDQPGVAMTLSEPPILTDVMSHRLSGVTPQQSAAVLDDVLMLLARPFAPGEAVVIKMGNIGNALGGDILARRTDSKALCLNAPLPVYLASAARKGLMGRIWARKLFVALRSARLTELGFTEDEVFEHTDLQIAADAWLALHRVMGQTSAQFGARVRSIGSEALLERPSAALTAIAAHFGLALDVPAIVEGPLFQRHAKSGQPFDANRRADELRDAAATHRDEIDMVVQWARSVADTQRIAWELLNSLAA